MDLPAGEVAARLGLPPNTLSFHFDRLRQAGLVTVRREGRSMIYAARYRHHERPARLSHRELLRRRDGTVRSGRLHNGNHPFAQKETTS